MMSPEHRASRMVALGEMSREFRGTRSATRHEMASSVDPPAVLGVALEHPHWASASVTMLVTRMPRWGNKRAASALRRAGVSQYTTVGRLTPRQRAALVAAVRDPAYRWEF